MKNTERAVPVPFREVPPAGPVRILLTTCHTGAGHARVAEALAEGFRRRYGGRVELRTTDVLAHYAPFPFNHLPAVGASITRRVNPTYRWGFRAMDGRRRADLFLRAFWPRVKDGFCRLLDDRVDVVVSTHTLMNHYLTWARRAVGSRASVVTVVTDPMEAHAVWLAPDADRVLVGSEPVRERAASLGIPRNAIRVTGLPVNPSFIDHLMGSGDARAVLGWDRRPLLLLAGGGDGIGSLDRIAAALDAGLDGVRLAVVTARNPGLRERLRRTRWRNPVHALGFVDHATEMSLLMSAADILVTKAGPGTLHDAYLAGLPVILSGSIPGQEDANVRQIVQAGAGVWAPRPRDVVDAARTWLSDPALRDRFARRSRSLARPEAAALAVDEIWNAGLERR